MKIFLCCKPNESALENHRESTSAKHESLNFPTVAAARDYYRDHGLKNMVIVIDHENGGELMTLLIRNPIGPQSEADKLAFDKAWEQNRVIKEAEFQSVRDRTKGKSVLE